MVYVCWRCRRPFPCRRAWHACVKRRSRSLCENIYSRRGVPEAGGEAAAAWFTDAYSLYSALADLSSSQLLAADNSPLNEEQLQQLNTAVAELRSNRDGAFSELGEEAKPFALAMSDALSEATANLESYQEKAEEPLLWATQQALLQALSDYENAIAAIKQ